MYGSSWNGGHFMKNFHFDSICTHYSWTTRTTEIQLCLWVHQQVCSDKMSSIAVKSYQYQQEIIFWPVSNSFLLYHSLTQNTHMLTWYTDLWVFSDQGLAVWYCSLSCLFLCFRRLPSSNLPPKLLCSLRFHSNVIAVTGSYSWACGLTQNK